MPLNYYVLSINTLKWRGRRFNMQNSCRSHRCQGPWMPFLLKRHWSPFSLSQPHLIVLIAAFSHDTKFSAGVPRAQSPAGAQTVPCIYRRRKRRTLPLPPLTSLTSSGTPSQGNGDSHKYSAVSLGFPAPIRKLSLCKFNDGDHGGKTSCIKI